MRYRASPQRGSQEPPTFLKLSLNFRETFVKLGPRQAAHEILGGGQSFHMAETQSWERSWAHHRRGVETSRRSSLRSLQATHEILGEAGAETQEILGPSSERRGDFAAELASLAAGSP